MAVKTCKRCELPKKEECFGKLSASPDGLRSTCRDCRKIESDLRYAKHGEKIREASRIRSNAYYYANHAAIRQRNSVREKAYGPRRNELRRNRRRHDPAYRLVTCLRARCRDFLTGSSKSAPTLELLGCSLEHLRAHLQSQFEPGMAWDNHGFGPSCWHIDHIRPCASFDLSDPAQQRECFGYKNLRPRWHFDNLSKGAKFGGRDFNLRNSEPTPTALPVS